MAKFLLVSLLFPTYKNMKEKQSTLVDLSFLLNGKLQKFGQGPFPSTQKNINRKLPFQRFVTLLIDMHQIIIMR